MKHKLASLLASDETLRQLSMGWRLDPAQKFVPKVTVLDKLFDDADLYQQVPVAVKHEFVTPKSEFARSHTEIRGCSSVAVGTLFEKQLIRKCGTSMDFSPLCNMHFFPPWHSLCRTRRSRPALVGIRGTGSPFNGVESLETQLFMKQASKTAVRSVNPLDYATWRQTAVRRFRKALFESFEHFSTMYPLYKIDGMYVVMIRRVPTQEEAKKIMMQFIARVAKQNHAWADKEVSMDGVERQLAKQELEVPNYTKREYWR